MSATEEHSQLPPAVREYVTGMDDEASSALLALDGIVRSVFPDFDVAIKYNIVLYAISRDWRHWVCALDAGRDRGARGVNIRFLWGVLLTDPGKVLRPGSSTLMTWDFPRGVDIDTAAVTQFVRQAVDLYPHYKANSKQISEEAKAAAAARKVRR